MLHVAEKAVFDHARDHELEDFDEVRREILRQTERLCGPGSGISEERIGLTIYSSNGKLCAVLPNILVMHQHHYLLLVNVVKCNGWC